MGCFGVPKRIDEGLLPNMQQMLLPQLRQLKRFVDQLVKRTGKIKSGRVDPRKDNMLKITIEGRKAALDMRLALPYVRDNPDSKTNYPVEKRASANISGMCAFESLRREYNHSTTDHYISPKR